METTSNQENVIACSVVGYHSLGRGQERWADVWMHPQTSSAFKSISKRKSLGQKLPENPFPHVQQQTQVRAFLT